MLGFLKGLGKAKERPTQENTGSKFKTKELAEGDISLGMCPSCSTVVSTEAKYVGEVSNIASEQAQVLQRFCTVCNTQIGSSDDAEKQVNRAVEAFRGNKEQVNLANDLNADDDDDVSNDVDAKAAFLDAFAPNILSEVGKGDVSVISGTETNTDSFQANLRERKNLNSKLWVSWIKSSEGKTIPCNELIALEGHWDSSEPSEEMVQKLSKKIIDLSDSKNIAILFVIKVK